MDERDSKIASLIDEKMKPIQDILKEKFPEDFTAPTVSSSPAPGMQDDFELTII